VEGEENKKISVLLKVKKQALTGLTGEGLRGFPLIGDR
jgi:hypothetical protein